MTRALLLLLLMIAGAGCGDATDTPTAPTVAEMTTEHFTGTLPVSGLKFYSFSLSRDSDYTVLLASLRHGELAGPA